MSTLDKAIAGAFVLIGIYLFVNPQNRANEIISSLSRGGVNLITALQGRSASGI